MELIKKVKANRAASRKNNASVPSQQLERQLERQHKENLQAASERTAKDQRMHEERLQSSKQAHRTHGERTIPARGTHGREKGLRQEG